MKQRSEKIWRAWTRHSEIEKEREKKHKSYDKCDKLGDIWRHLEQKEEGDWKDMVGINFKEFLGSMLTSENSITE